jgi:PAS domain S-box-containing protein
MSAHRPRSNEPEEAPRTTKNPGRLPVRSSRPLAIGDLKTLFERAPFGVLAIGTDGRIGYINPRQCENSQLPREFFIGRNHRAEFLSSLERAGLLDPYDRLLTDGTPFERTIVDYKRHVDGTTVAFSMRGYRSGGWNLLVTSIEHVLADQQAAYLQLFESANDGIFILSRDGRFVNANRKFTEIVGVPLASLIGQTAEVFLPGRFQQSRERLERILREGRLGPYELEISTPLGRKFISLNGFALVEDGKAVGVINIARDTTEEHRAADELRQARDQALESSRLKSAFLANMSHEIRTPLNVILGYSSLVAEYLAESGDDSQRVLLDGIQGAGRRLQDTINSILDISRIEAGAFEVWPERVELAPLIDRQLRDFQTLARAKNLSLAAETETADAVVRFDRYCLEHALTNLLANAVKFTESGDVRVRLARNEGGALSLSVRDTGIGIDASFLARLGETFAQEDSGLGRRFGGSGLGLALTKSYLELNGARLSVESEKGKGSVFRIHFAAAA